MPEIRLADIVIRIPRKAFERLPRLIDAVFEGTLDSVSLLCHSLRDKALSKGWSDLAGSLSFTVEKIPTGANGTVWGYKYGRILEYGRKKGTRGGEQPPRPWILPTLLEKRDQITTFYKEAVLRLLEELSRLPKEEERIG